MKDIAGERSNIMRELDEIVKDMEGTLKELSEIVKRPRTQTEEPIQMVRNIKEIEQALKNRPEPVSDHIRSDSPMFNAGVVMTLKWVLFKRDSL
jgi:hypothetical protein